MENNNFIEKFQSKYIGIMNWDDFEDFWLKLKQNAHNWFYYDTELAVPSEAVVNISAKLDVIYNTIKDLHKERYCGLVYVDCLQNPLFIKIFHPHNLGRACGSSEEPPLPRWLISKIAPVDMVKQINKPSIKKNWINKLF